MNSSTRNAVALTAWLAVVTVGSVAPAILGILIGVTPNELIGHADAGQFISATASAGGFFTPGISTLQTTRGSFTVNDHLSVNRGQHLDVVDTTKGALRLCVVGTPPVYAEFSGQWAGPLQAVAHAYHRFTPLVTSIGSDGVSLWLMVGILVSLVSGVTAAVATAPALSDDADKPKAPT